MPNTAIDIEPTVPALPEGWQGTPQELLEWFCENATFSATGNFLAGQIGGAEPTQDIGVWITEGEIWLWDTTLETYVPLITEPIGTVKSYMGPGSTPPDNHLFMEGQTLAKEGDYAALYAVVGDVFKRPSDPVDEFRLPDCRGRTIAGSGLGNYDPKGTGANVGNITERSFGEFFGTEWPGFKQSTQALAPTPRYYYVAYRSRPYNGLFYTGNTPPTVYLRWMVRFR